MRCVLLNRLLSVWYCVYLWYPRFLMRCVLLNRLLSVWCCAYLWYIRGKHDTTQKGNDWVTRTSIRTGDIRGKQKCVAQPFTFCVVLCLPLISPVLNEVCVIHSLLSGWGCVFPWYPRFLIGCGDTRGKHNTTQKANDWVTHTSLRTGDIRGKHNTTQKGNDWVPVLNEVSVLNRLLSVWCCVFPWYPRFLMMCVLLNRLLSVWCCVFPWYPRFLMRCVLLNRLLSV
jgi:hypothetical protein